MNHDTVMRLVKELMPRPPAGHHVQFVTRLDDFADRFEIQATAWKGEDARGYQRSKRTACVSIDHRELQNSKRQVVDFVADRLRLLFATLFPVRPMFRIGTKPHAKRLVLNPVDVGYR